MSMAGGFHLHLPHRIHHHGRGGGGGVRKGQVVIVVGGQGEERERVAVPVDYLNHPLFMELLKEAEEEYGFEHEGAVTIPCRLAQFRRVKGLIDREASAGGIHHHGHHHGHLLHAGCFGRA